MAVAVVGVTEASVSLVTFKVTLAMVADGSARRASAFQPYEAGVLSLG